MLKRRRSRAVLRRNRHVQLSALVLLGLAAAHGPAGCAVPAQVPEPRRPEDALGLDLSARGEELAGAGDDIRAEHYFVAALEVGAPVDEVLPRLLKVCVRSQRYSSALQYAQDYGSGAEPTETLQLVTASLYLATADVGKAQALLERLVASGASARAHLMLGDIYAEDLRDYARADEQYTAYLALAPDDAEAAQVRLRLLHPLAPSGVPRPGERPETVGTP